jgi:predicted aspartyl protease
MKFPYIKTPQADPTKKWLSRPLIPVIIFGPKSNIEVLALIDSGADICLFNEQIGREIGLEIEKGKTEAFMGIEGGRLVAYIHKIKLQVVGIEKIIEIEAGFVDSPAVNAILGQEGFFDAFKIKFEKDHNIIEITPSRKH